MPQLVKTTQQLRRMFCKGILIDRIWDRLGPCPEFISTPAVEFSSGGKSYIVFIPFYRFCTLHTKFLDDTKKRKQ